MGGGPIIVRNKIGCGYAAPVASTGVDPARGRGWRNFAARASSPRAAIGGAQQLGTDLRKWRKTALLGAAARSVVAWMRRMERLKASDLKRLGCSVV
jgi:hypothetical protein